MCILLFRWLFWLNSFVSVVLCISFIFYVIFGEIFHVYYICIYVCIYVCISSTNLITGPSMPPTRVQFRGEGRLGWDFQSVFHFAVNVDFVWWKFKLYPSIKFYCVYFFAEPFPGIYFFSNMIKKYISILSCDFFQYIFYESLKFFDNIFNNNILFWKNNRFVHDSWHTTSSSTHASTAHTGIIHGWIIKSDYDNGIGKLRSGSTKPSPFRTRNP